MRKRHAVLRSLATLRPVKLPIHEDGKQHLQHQRKNNIYIYMYLHIFTHIYIYICLFISKCSLIYRRTSMLVCIFNAVVCKSLQIKSPICEVANHHARMSKLLRGNKVPLYLDDIGTSHRAARTQVPSRYDP